MKTIKIIFLYLFFGLSFLVRGQQIGNYVNNPSFELSYGTSTIGGWNAAPYWPTIADSMNCAGLYLCTKSTGDVPYFFGYQWPRSGDRFAISQFYCSPATCQSSDRLYPLNVLKKPLKSNTVYCGKFYVVNTNNCVVGIDGYGIYFGDYSIDTIKTCLKPLTYLVPQIQYTGSVVTDTLNWTPITGTFVASGGETYMLLGNFKTNSATNTMVINPTYLPSLGTDVIIDDVSLIEYDLPAFAGRDTSILLGDSVFLGRMPEFGLDELCTWYKLPSNTPIDTIAGFWIKPVSNSTYIVRQEICGNVKWDTVVVNISTNYVGLDKLQSLSNNINLFPNPTSGNLSISGFIGSDNTTFSISNCLGQNVLNGDIIKKNNLITIETSELESGLYQIHLKTQYTIVTKKFVKTN
jgi:hypothetical protein